MTERHKKALYAAAIAIFILFTLAVSWFVGRPLIRFVRQPEQFRAWVQGHGLLVFLFVRRFGVKAVEVFFPREKIESLRFLHNEKRLALWVFILFFIPGTPKDIMTYIVPLTPMKLSTFLLLSTVARLPSVVTSTIGGNALGTGKLTFALIVFGATALISALGILIYRRICKRSEARQKEEQA